MNCTVYKGSKKADTYLYVEKTNEFDRVPDALLQILGQLELVLELELRADINLAQANVSEVMQQLTGQGYYLQMPPGTGNPLDD